MPRSRRRVTASSTVVEGVSVAREERGVIQDETRRRFLWTGVPTKTRSFVPGVLNALATFRAEIVRRIRIKSVGCMLVVCSFFCTIIHLCSVLNSS